MEQETTNTYVSRAKNFVQQNRKMVGIVLALAFLFMVWNWYQAQPKSISPIVNVNFSGYDGYGTLDYNVRDVQEEVAKIAYKNVGFTDNQAKDLFNSDPIILAEVGADAALQSKYRKAQAIMQSVSYSFDRDTGLSNGDKVVLTVRSSSSKSPIKAEAITFNVEGLTPFEIVSVDEVRKEYPIEAKGFNGYGRLELPKYEGWDLMNIESNKKKNFKNGDVVSLSLSENYIQQLRLNGKKLEAETIDFEVSGLNELTDIGNVSQAMEKNDAYVKSRYVNSDSVTYTIEKQKDYIGYETTYDDMDRISFATIYKISSESKYFNRVDVNYVYYGYRYGMDNNNDFDLQTGIGFFNYETPDLEALIANFTTSGFTEYTPTSTN